MSTHSTVRILSLSRFFPDSVEIFSPVSVVLYFVSCTDYIWTLIKMQSGLRLPRFCPDSVRILEKSCMLSVCPAVQERDRAVQTFTLLVRRRLINDFSSKIPWNLIRIPILEFSSDSKLQRQVKHLKTA